MHLCVCQTHGVKIRFHGWSAPLRGASRALFIGRAGEFTGLEVQDLKHDRRLRRHSNKHLAANAGAAISGVSSLLLEKTKH